MTTGQIGMSVYVYRSPLGDFTKGGVTSKHTSLILIGDEVPQVFEATENMPALILKYREDYIYAQPAINPTGKPWMMGGNFIYSSNGWFEEINPGPIPVHDRQE